MDSAVQCIKKSSALRFRDRPARNCSPAGTSAHESQFLMQLSHGFLGGLAAEGGTERNTEPSACGRSRFAADDAGKCTDKASFLLALGSRVPRHGRTCPRRQHRRPWRCCCGDACGSGRAPGLARCGMWQEVWVSALPLLAQVPGPWPGLAPPLTSLDPRHAPQ